MRNDTCALTWSVFCYRFDVKVINVHVFALLILYSVYTTKGSLVLWFRPVQIERVGRRQNKFDSKVELCFRKSRKHCGKRRKCWLPAFSPFPTMFSKALVPRVIKSRDCVVKELIAKSFGPGQLR